jgi:hypothetical protein
MQLSEEDEGRTVECAACHRLVFVERVREATLTPRRARRVVLTHVVLAVAMLVPVAILLAGAEFVGGTVAGISWVAAKPQPPNAKCPVCGHEKHIDYDRYTMRQQMVIPSGCPLCGHASTIAEWHVAAGLVVHQV